MWRVGKYIYMYMCVRVCVCTYACVWPKIKYIYVCVNVCDRKLYMYIYIYVCGYICIYIYMCVGMCVRVKIVVSSGFIRNKIVFFFLGFFRGRLQEEKTQEYALSQQGRWGWGKFSWFTLDPMMADWNHHWAGGCMRRPFACKDQVFVMLCKVLPTTRASTVKLLFL